MPQAGTSSSSPSRRRAPFLTAEWRSLVMVNYQVDPAILEPYVPFGTELDTYRGTCLVSMVGFLFDKTRVFGRVPIPWHSRFEEVNLRFYVRRQRGDEVRRGVVFIKELVPSRSVTWVARTLFQENYQRLPMGHTIDWYDPTAEEEGGRFCYRWRFGGGWSELVASTAGPLSALQPGGLSAFITEHYWGYSRQSSGGTLEYQVEHPPWRVWEVESCACQTEVAPLYGAEFVASLSQRPHSALVAEGSPVAVYRGQAMA